jgi:hypothetical protein
MDKKMKSNHIIIMIVAMLVIAVVCGVVGYKIGGKMSQVKRFAQFNGVKGQGNMMVGGKGGQVRAGGRAINGEILSVDTNGVTVKIADGSSKIVLMSDKTVVNKAEVAKVTDLKTGDKVMVFGTENSDGSVSANNVQLTL